MVMNYPGDSWAYQSRGAQQNNSIIGWRRFLRLSFPCKLKYLYLRLSRDSHLGKKEKTKYSNSSIWIIWTWWGDKVQIKCLLYTRQCQKTTLGYKNILLVYSNVPVATTDRLRCLHYFCWSADDPATLNDRLRCPIAINHQLRFLYWCHWPPPASHCYW